MKQNSTILERIQLGILMKTSSKWSTWITSKNYWMRYLHSGDLLWQNSKIQTPHKLIGRPLFNIQIIQAAHPNAAPVTLTMVCSKEFFKNFSSNKLLNFQISDSHHHHHHHHHAPTSPEAPFSIQKQLQSSMIQHTTDQLRHNLFSPVINVRI